MSVPRKYKVEEKHPNFRIKRQHFKNLFFNKDLMGTESFKTIFSYNLVQAK